MKKDALQIIEEMIGPMTVGRLIRVCRKRLELDQSDLAEKLNVTKAYISNIETGKKLLSLEQVMKICKKLEQNEKVWMTVFFEEEARRVGKKNFQVTITEKKRA